MKKHKFPLPDIRIVAALFVLLLCLKGCSLNYEQIYKATPDYSLQRLVQAIQNDERDTALLYLDDTAVAAQFFDSMAAKSSGIESLPILQLAWAPLRTDFIEDSSHLFRLSFNTNIDEAARSEASQAVRMRIQSLGFAIPLAGWHYVSSQYAHKTDADHAELTITLYNDHLEASVPCTLLMTRQTRFCWRITGIKDPDSFIAAVQNARQQRLKAYNQPLERQLASLVKIERVSASLVKNNDRQTYLRITYTPVFTSKPEEFQEIRGTYELQRKSDKAVLYAAELRLTPEASGKPHTSQFLLNPLIPSQYALINRDDLNDTSSDLHITSITRQDGSTLSLAEKLPDDE